MATAKKFKNKIMKNTKINNIEENENAVKVYLRIRPKRNDEKSCQDLFSTYNNTELAVESPIETYAYKNCQRTNNDHLHKFSFTRIFENEDTQKYVYEKSILSSVMRFIEGYNCLNFTYGVTNSGKTYTLVGDDNQPGLLHNALSTIFLTINSNLIASIPNYRPELYDNVSHTTKQMIKEMDNIKTELLKMVKTGDKKLEKENLNFALNTINENEKKSMEEIKCGTLKEIVDDNVPTTYYIYMSIAEIYNEKIYDLLNSKLISKLKPNMKKSPLSIGSDANGFCYIKDLTHVLIKNFDEALDILKAGKMQRQIAMTKLNMQSSRSHVIYGLKIIKVYHLPNEIITKNNEMCFVDLAGSERPSKAQIEGIRFKEASNINLSLLVLGKCIEIIKQNRTNNINYNSAVVPFRESKLTRLLQPFFISYSNINLFANISTAFDSFDETLNSLRFSSLTMEALTRPMTLSLMEMNITKNDNEYQNMNKNELIHQINNMKKTIEMLESEKHVIEIKIRRECYEENKEMMKNIDLKHKKHLSETKKNIIELYKNKLVHLEDYYKECLKIDLNETNIKNNSLLVSLENELNRKIEEADKLKEEYHEKLLQNKIDEENKINNEKEIFNKELESLKSQIINLQDNISIKQNEISNYIMKIEEENEKNKSLELELENIKNQLIEKIAEIELQIEEKTKATLELASLQNIIIENEEKIKKLEVKTYIDDPVYISLKKERDELKETLICVEHQAARFGRKIDRDESRMKLLREDIIKKEELIRKLRLENFSLKDEVSMMNSKNSLKNDPSLNETNISYKFISNNNTPVSVKKAKKSTNKNITSSPRIEKHNSNLQNVSGGNNFNSINEITVPIDSSEISFRRLYEDAREYAYRMEQRVRELQIENLPSVPKSKIQKPSKLEIDLNIDISNKEFEDEIKKMSEKRKSIKRSNAEINETKTNSDENKLKKQKVLNEIPSSKIEVNPSTVFRIDSTSPQSRKAATKEYLKRLKVRNIDGEVFINF